GCSTSRSAGLGTPKNFVHEIRGASGHIASVRAARHQTDSLHEIAVSVDPRQPKLESELYQLGPVHCLHLRRGFGMHTPKRIILKALRRCTQKRLLWQDGDSWG